MNPLLESCEFAAEAGADFSAPSPYPWSAVRCPGLTPEAKGVANLAHDIFRRLSVYSFRRAKDFLVVMLLGGTGTGKSTIFNALCGETISETGVERPKTCGAIAYARRNIPIDEAFPFPAMKIVRTDSVTARRSPRSGAPGELVVVEHDRRELSHLVILDTPDVDSVEAANRQTVEDLYLLADAAVFVGSEEKYADEVPFQFLRRIVQEGRPHFLLFNKLGSALTPEEIIAALRNQGLHIREDFFRAFPYVASDSSEGLRKIAGFQTFASAFFHRFAGSEAPRIMEEEKRRAKEEIVHKTAALLGCIEKERSAAAQWMQQLETLYQEACRTLFDQEEGHFSVESRDYLLREIRKMYNRYDVLGRPRRFVARLILSPLRLLGLQVPIAAESHEEALLRIKRKVDLNPIRSALASFNRSALERLSPQDEAAALYKSLRDPRAMLTDEEVKIRIGLEQEQLALWLEASFQKLARGIPKSKEYGIYSTSILWGGLILALETAIGGGISVIEAVLDSAIAPFVTKGAVELFAYHELQNIARELADRYREGLTAALREQRNRYEECLQALLTPPEAVEAIRRELVAMEAAGMPRKKSGLF